MNRLVSAENSQLLISSSADNVNTVGAKRYTLAEIARASGCSKAVVSTVLNGSRGNTVVGRDLRERVQRVARDVGYVPNHASRSLAIGSSQTLGFYVTPGPSVNVGAEYESAILRGVSSACQAAGYDVLIFNLVGERAMEETIRKIASRRVDGVVLVRARAGNDNLARLLATGENIVAVDFNEPEPLGLRVTRFDNTAAMQLAVDHLVGLGHRRIGYIGGGVANPVPDDLARRAGFAAAMNAAGLKVDPKFMICHRADSTITQHAPAQSWGWEAVDSVMELGEDRPTAMVVWSDSIAVTAMQRFNHHGLRLPNDMSLVGVDNSPSCRVVWPQLTSVNHPLVDMGAEAARMLMAHSEAKRHAQQVTIEALKVFRPELVVRGTTARYSRATL
jgi:DNA-binding LacI/PurR family transcriptional regulator